MAGRVPLVDYLVLEPEPHLVANECTSCGARFFDHRSGCAKCSGAEFKKVDIDTGGVLRTFTIVSMAAPGIEVPFVASIVDCGGTSVKANIINCPADPSAVKLGMAVKLATYSLGEDTNGTEAIGFGFEPKEAN
jgi:uncharacterized protein